MPGQHTKARQSGEEKQHNLDRRVTLPDLRELLLAAGGAPSDDVISTLASRYGVADSFDKSIILSQSFVLDLGVA